MEIIELFKELEDGADLLELKDKAQKHYDGLKTQFQKIYATSQPIIDNAKKHISKPYGQNPEALSEDLMTAASLASTLDSFISTVQSMLDVYSILYYTPKSKENTEADRKLFFESRTILIRTFLNQLKALEDKLSKKISIGQSILRYETNRPFKEQ